MKFRTLTARWKMRRLRLPPRPPPPHQRKAKGTSPTASPMGTQVWGKAEGRTSRRQPEGIKCLD